jgi:hypothetical protein
MPRSACTKATGRPSTPCIEHQSFTETRDRMSVGWPSRPQAIDRPEVQHLLLEEGEQADLSTRPASGDRPSHQPYGWTQPLDESAGRRRVDREIDRPDLGGRGGLDLFSGFLGTDSTLLLWRRRRHGLGDHHDPHRVVTQGHEVRNLSRKLQVESWPWLGWPSLFGEHH